MHRRTNAWMIRLMLLGAGGTLLQAAGGCDETTRTLVAQGVSSLIISVANQLIQTGVTDLFGLPTGGGGF